MTDSQLSPKVNDTRFAVSATLHVWARTQEDVAAALASAHRNEHNRDWRIKGKPEVRVGGTCDISMNDPAARGCSTDYGWAWAAYADGQRPPGRPA